MTTTSGRTGESEKGIVLSSRTVPAIDGTAFANRCTTLWWRSWRGTMRGRQQLRTWGRVSFGWAHRRHCFDPVPNRFVPFNGTQSRRARWRNRQSANRVKWPLRIMWFEADQRKATSCTFPWSLLARRERAYPSLTAVLSCWQRRRRAPGWTRITSGSSFGLGMTISMTLWTSGQSHLIWVAFLLAVVERRTRVQNEFGPPSPLVSPFRKATRSSFDGFRPSLRKR